MYRLTNITEQVNKIKVSKDNKSNTTDNKFIYNIADDIVELNDYETIIRYFIFKYNSEFTINIEKIPIYDSIFKQTVLYLSSEEGNKDLKNICRFFESGSVNHSINADLFNKFTYRDLLEMQSYMMNIIIDEGTLYRYIYKTKKDQPRYDLLIILKLIKSIDTKNVHRENNISYISVFLSILMKHKLKLHTNVLENQKPITKIITNMIGETVYDNVIKYEEDTLIKELEKLDNKLSGRKKTIIEQDQEEIQPSKYYSIEDIKYIDKLINLVTNKNIKVTFNKDEYVDNKPITSLFFKKYIGENLTTYNEIANN